MLKKNGKLNILFALYRQMQYDHSYDESIRISLK